MAKKQIIHQQGDYKAKVRKTKECTACEGSGKSSGHICGYCGGRKRIVYYI